MQAAENERAVIEAYLEEHQLDAALNDAVNAIVKARPPDPLVELATSLSNASKAAHRILDVTAREVLAGNGFPALEVTITTQRGAFAASTSLPPYDDEERHKGRGVRKAADSVRTLLLEKLVGKDVLSAQEAIDRALASDASAPENAVLACSIACVCPRAAASRAVRARGPRPPSPPRLASPRGSSTSRDDVCARAPGSLSLRARRPPPTAA